jgi:hypothetical protein
MHDSSPSSSKEVKEENTGEDNYYGYYNNRPRALFAEAILPRVDWWCWLAEGEAQFLQDKP